MVSTIVIISLLVCPVVLYQAIAPLEQFYKRISSQAPKAIPIFWIMLSALMLMVTSLWVSLLVVFSNRT
jgi:hypothetical protein